LKVGKFFVAFHFFFIKKLYEIFMKFFIEIFTKIIYNQEDFLAVN